MPNGGNQRFATTHWGLVLEAGGSSSGAGPALSRLCEEYWPPVYAFIRRTGESPEDARDLTQAFFARLLEKSVLSVATPERGRFRSFLLTSVRHFLANDRDARRTLKRGGGVQFVPLDLNEGERHAHVDPADPVTPEHVYERRWTLTVLDEALKRVAARYRETERGRLFDALAPTITAQDTPSYGDLAQQLDMSEGALRVAVHRLRREFGSALRETVLETVENTADVEDELRYLLQVLAR